MQFDDKSIVYFVYNKKHLEICWWNFDHFFLKLYTPLSREHIPHNFHHCCLDRVGASQSEQLIFPASSQPTLNHSPLFSTCKPHLASLSFPGTFPTQSLSCSSPISTLMSSSWAFPGQMSSSWVLSLGRDREAAALVRGWQQSSPCSARCKK